MNFCVFSHSCASRLSPLFAPKRRRDIRTQRIYQRRTDASYHARYLLRHIRVLPITLSIDRVVRFMRQYVLTDGVYFYRTGAMGMRR
jgi:hypothetical protein